MNLVEVFVEENCSACGAVLALLERSLAGLPLMKKVFNRDMNRKEFQSRGITILPATFINGQLAFYGEFSESDFHRQFKRLSRPA